VLNLAGAALVYFTIQRVKPMHSMGPTQSPIAAMIEHWRNPRLRAAFGIGFCILFAFIGTFTYVNFVLVRPPLSLGMMDLGLVYFVASSGESVGGSQTIRNRVRPNCGNAVFLASNLCGSNLLRLLFWLWTLWATRLRCPQVHKPVSRRIHRL
jgi:hypothetical protein